MKQFLYFLTGLSGALAGCQVGPVPTDITAITPACQIGSRCTLAGTMEIREVNHVEMAVLTKGIDDPCVQVSLSPESISRVRSSSNRWRITGETFPNVTDPDILWTEYGGRRVGLGMCGDYYIFATRIDEVE